MTFAHDTTAALVLAADLVNSDELTDVAALEVFLDKHLVEPRRAATAADVDAVHALRPRLRAVWQAAVAARRGSTRCLSRNTSRAATSVSSSELTRSAASTSAAVVS